MTRLPAWLVDLSTYLGGTRLFDSRWLRVPALIGFLFASASALEAQTTSVTATWNANTESNIAGYVLSYGTQTGVYTTSVNVGNLTTWQGPLTSGEDYYFAVQAYNTSLQYSPYSAQVSFDVGAVPPPAPSLTTVNPASGAIGTAATITGANFGATQGTSTVTFNGTAATPTAWSGTSLVAPVPSGATTGSVVVTVGGQASNAVPFTVSTPPPPPPAPTLTSLTPAAGGVGTAVAIAGTNFGATQGTSTLTFNGTATSATSWSASSIDALVPAGATTGTVVVTVGGEASNAVTFTVLQTLVVTATWNANTESNIAGYALSYGTQTGVYTTSVNVGNLTTWQGPLTAGVDYYFAVQAYNTSLQYSPYSAQVSFDVGGVPSPAPSLTMVNPTSGAVGTAATITGTNFGASQGTSTVTFNGTAATPTAWSGTSLVAPVPSGATTGAVVVTVGGQASNAMPFTVSTPPPPPPPSPTLTSLTPAAAGVGTAVTIAGTNFGATQGTSTLTFNGTATPATSWSAGSIGALIPAGATTGPVVVTVGGQASNAITFTVLQTLVVTATWNANTESNIAGYALSYGTQTGVYTTSVNVGNLTTWQGPLTSGVDYYFAVQAYNTSLQYSPYSAQVSFDVGGISPPAPSLTMVNPTSGAVGTAATITGTNFGATQGTSTVTFNGTAATPTAWSSTSLVAPVPSGATTGTVVVTVGGQASNAMPFTVSTPPPPPPPSPSLTSLSPAAGGVGTAVTIAGTNFGATQGTSTLTFNGTATSATSWSATSIAALVPAGATTGPLAVTVGGQASNAITFTVIQTAVVTATWNANTESNIAGYVLSYGTQTGVYTVATNVGDVTTWQGPLTSGVGYYFAVQAYNTSLQYSPYSAQVFYTVGAGTALTQTLTAPANRSAPTATVSPSLASSNVAPVTTTIIDPTLAAFWQLNDGVGTTAFDASGRGMNGTLVDGPVWAAGHLGGALSFDGINNHVTTSFVENLATWTVAAWVQSPAAPRFGSGSGPVQREKNFQINWNDTDPTLRGAVALSAGGTWYAASFGPLAANTWYHLVGTFDGNTLRAYVNGVLATANSAPAGNPDLEPLPLELGARAGAPSYFAGVVSGVRIYGRAISAAEVTALAQPDVTPPTAVTLSASLTRQSVSLSWTAAADPNSGVSLYRIYRGTTAGGTKSPLAEGLATAQGYQDQATAAFTTYYYEVSAVNGSGIEGPRSNEWVVVTSDTLNIAP